MESEIQKHVEGKILRESLKRILSVLSSHSAFDSTLIQVFHIMESELGFENPKLQILNFSRSLHPIRSRKREEVERKKTISPTYDIIEINGKKLLISPIRIEGRDVGFISSFVDGKEAKNKRCSETFMLDLLYIIGQILGFAFFILAKEKAEVRNVGGIIYRSREMDEVLKMSLQIAKSDATVLILGESGVGKELIAELIHRNSQRKGKPFVKINCAAIPENLLESELFGYKKGAFTGAIMDKKGKFEEAEGGTIFLDEIGDMPLSLQAKILRVLQSKEIEPIGGKPKKVDVRILAATNKNLEEMVKQGKFREDLFYRLNVVPVVVPPLRERREDIRPLIEHFIDKFNKKYSKNVSISKGAVMILERYSWPGNVRELENLIERLVLTSSDLVITPGDIPDYIKDEIKKNENLREIGISNVQDKQKEVGTQQEKEKIASEGSAEKEGEAEEEIKIGEDDGVSALTEVFRSVVAHQGFSSSRFSLPELVENIEREYIKSILRQSRSISDAARKLGMTRRQLEWRIRKYRLNPSN